MGFDPRRAQLAATRFPNTSAAAEYLCDQDARGQREPVNSQHTEQPSATSVRMLTEEQQASAAKKHAHAASERKEHARVAAAEWRVRQNADLTPAERKQQQEKKKLRMQLLRQQSASLSGWV